MITTPQQRARIEASGCEVRFDTLTRQLYATDASVYRIEPAGVAFPKTSHEAAAVIRAAAEAGVWVNPRGAGSGLSGGAVGDGLVIDFARYNREIHSLDIERSTVRVGAGVVLDQLNDFLKPRGFCFGPDVATSSRATVGGMIANNSSGARAPRYGTTIDHVAAIEAVLADGRIVTLGPGHEEAPDIAQAVHAIIEANVDRIREEFPHILVKRWPGYGFDRYLRHNNDLTRVIGGSEGTLAGIFSAELNIVPLPERIGKKGLALVFFSSVSEAMQATVEFLDLKPVAIEYIDDTLYDQTRGQLAFTATRAMLRLDEEPCPAILIVEFYEDADARLAEIERRNVGLRKLLLTDPRQMEMVWAMRKAGLSLLTGRKGSAKPVPGIEDVEVRPEQLPEYVAALQTIMDRLQLDVSFYGHAASGLLHVRPIMDLHTQRDVEKYRTVAEEVSVIVRQFKGSIVGEHGIGIAKTEFMPHHIGPELLAAMAGVKRVFDPGNTFNPGKIIGDGRYRFDGDLRMGAGYALELPFRPVLAFAVKDGSFIGNLEQCNGCGGCKKDPPVMCPTFIATGEEVMSTRGRANTIRSVLERRAPEYADPLRAADLGEALEYCLACKACAKECPSNVDMSLLKAELLHARQERQGLTLRDRMVSRVDILGALGCLTPRLANATLASRIGSQFMEHVLGIAAERRMPAYALERFDRWFQRRGPARPGPRGPVILWDDCFVRYNEPHIGQAAVRVLEAAGYHVILAEGHACCGRPAFSVGRLDLARQFGDRNVRLLRSMENAPVVFLEPSCYSMFSHDYLELQIDGAAEIAKRAFLFEQFVEALLAREAGALAFKALGARVYIHAHCHAKALTDTGVQRRLAERIPNTPVAMLDSGCCGMAGAFGMIRSKYALSLKVAEPLVKMIGALDPEAAVIASGTSCRHQILALTPRRPLHIAELLERSLASPR